MFRGWWRRAKRRDDLTVADLARTFEKAAAHAQQLAFADLARRLDVLRRRVSIVAALNAMGREADRVRWRWPR